MRPPPYIIIWADKFQHLMRKSYENGSHSVTKPVPTKKILDALAAPPYSWRIKEKELDEMIAYIKSLGIAVFKNKKGCWYDPKVQEIADKLKGMNEK
jgi:hypothetical protein